MSWQAYVDQNLLGDQGKYIAQAAILGQQGGIWATSSGFNLNPKAQADIIKMHSDIATTQTNGIVVDGQKYFTLQVNERSFYGKQKADGIIIVKTKQAILVAVYKYPAQAPQATPIVEGLADYLISVGY